MQGWIWFDWRSFAILRCEAGCEDFVWCVFYGSPNTHYMVQACWSGWMSLPYLATVYQWGSCKLVLTFVAGRQNIWGSNSAYKRGVLAVGDKLWEVSVAPMPIGIIKIITSDHLSSGFLFYLHPSMPFTWVSIRERVSSKCSWKKFGQENVVLIISMCWNTTLSLCLYYTYFIGQGELKWHT